MFKEGDQMETPIGISDMKVYVPRARIEIESLKQKRSESNPRLQRHLDRARRTTGQRSIRFPCHWEDASTMAAQAAHALIQTNPQIDLASLRYLTVGTESSTDHSKPISSYVEGMLNNAGINIPESLSSFQVQHACAAGTLSLMSVSALLAMGQRPWESGIVIASDIAKYETATTAEITQGAGSVALLVESDPRLIELDLSTPGYCSRDVDDFFRPLGSSTPRVKGQYSMQCYIQNLESAFVDHCMRRGEDPSKVLESTDYFVLHAPFRNMPDIAMQRLLNRFLGYSCEQAEEFLNKRGFYSALEPVADIGNIYTGSMYLCLASLLDDRYRTMGKSIVGKNVLMASYGSGNTMIVLSGSIAPRAPEVLERWDLRQDIYTYRSAGMDEYELWISSPHTPEANPNMIKQSEIAPQSFFLAGVREDGYREYKFNVPVGDWNEEREAPIDLHRPATVLS